MVSEREKGNVLFNDTLNTFYLVIWRQTYGKVPQKERENQLMGVERV